MRTEQERMELIRKRTLEIRKKEKKRRQRIIDMGCAAACVLLIICLGMLMPQITAQTEGKGWMVSLGELPAFLAQTVHRGIS